jgi:hypothetical protein
VYENATFWVADAFLALEITGTFDGVLILMVRVADPVPVAFVALMVTLFEPTAVGVPLMTPVDVLMLKPLGRPVAL